MGKKTIPQKKHVAPKNKVIRLTINIETRFLRKLIPIVFGLLVILFVTASSVLAYSLVLKRSGDTEYKNKNYTNALAIYQKAESLWFPKRINYYFRDRDLENKTRKAQVMIDSNQNYFEGIKSFNSYLMFPGEIDNALQHFRLVVENDSNYADAQAKISAIQEIKYPTKTTQKPSTSQPTTNTAKVTQINCTGPDGKQFTASEADCKKLNAAWAQTIYSELNKDYVIGSGLTVRVNSISKNEESGSNKYTVSYYQENKTTDKKINEVTFVMIFSDGSRQNQYGFFSSIFPGASLSKSYTFETLKTQLPTGIQLNEDTGSNLKWRIGN